MPAARLRPRRRLLTRRRGLKTAARVVHLQVVAAVCQCHRHACGCRPVRSTSKRAALSAARMHACTAGLPLVSRGTGIAAFFC